MPICQSFFNIEICLGVDLEPDEWIKDSGCSKHMTGNRKLFSSDKAYNEDWKTPPPSKTSPLVDDDLEKEEAIKVAENKILENDIEDETLEIDEVVNIKESRNHPLENVIGNLNQRTLRRFYVDPIRALAVFVHSWDVVNILVLEETNRSCYIHYRSRIRHQDHVFACLCHMLYCIETSTPYNLAFFILKRMKKTRNKPNELLPYGMLLTRLFKHVVSIFPELAIDHYLSYDRVMHPFAPYYERKTRSDHGKKIPCDSNASSSSTTLNHPSLFHP
ncbi:hypothetical protein Tco_1104866 [Tanacetum coccineum]